MQQAVAVLTLPLLGVLACAAEDLAALLGPGWSEAVPAVRALAAVQAVNALSLLTGPVLQALGRPGLLSVLVWGRSLVLALALVGMGVILAGESVASQLSGMLVAAGLGTVLSGVVSSVVAARLVDLSLLRLARASAPAVAAAVAGGAAVLLAAGTLDSMQVLVRLVTDLSLGSAAAGCCRAAGPAAGCAAQHRSVARRPTTQARWVGGSCRISAGARPTVSRRAPPAICDAALARAPAVRCPPSTAASAE